MPLVLPHTRALTNNYLVSQLLDVFLAFEALTDHPYGFSSLCHGYFPMVSSWDGCNKLAVNIDLEKYLDQRGEHVIDMDRTAVWLAVSLLSPMYFSKRLQFTHDMPVTFCPQNRKSNILKLPARGPAARSGDVEAGDGGALRQFVEEHEGGLALEALLLTMTMEQLKVLYGKVFGAKRPGVSR